MLVIWGEILEHWSRDPVTRPGVVDDFFWLYDGGSGDMTGVSRKPQSTLANFDHRIRTRGTARGNIVNLPSSYSENYLAAQEKVSDRHDCHFAQTG